MAKQGIGTTRFEISYEDGTAQVVKVKPRHLIALEDEGGFGEESTTPMRDSMKLAWLASESSIPFDDWLKLVDDLETIRPDIPSAVELSVDGGPAEAVPTA